MDSRFPVRWLVPAILVFVLACSFPGLGKPALGTPTPQAVVSPMVSALPTFMSRGDLPPTLVDSDPPPEGELPLTGSVTLYFSQAMQTAAVEAAFSTQPSIAGHFSWPDETTLVFTPDRPLQPDTTMIVYLGETAQASNGKTLIRPFRLRFRTASALHLTRAIPVPGAKDVDPSAPIVVAFNRPVVDLSLDEASLPRAFTILPASIGPAPAGRGEWVNASTYAFYPQRPLYGGVDYLVNLEAGLTSRDGSPLITENLHWAFTTAMPKLVSIDPSAEKPIPLDAAFSLTFNQPMDVKSVTQNISLQSDGQAVAAELSWNGDKTVLTYTPKEMLERGKKYILRLDSSIAAVSGTPLGKTYQFYFTSTPRLRVLRSQPTQDSTLAPQEKISLFFTAPLTDEDLNSYINIIPTVAGLKISLSDDSQALYISGQFAYSTEYRLTISADLPDRWGAKLGEIYRLDFRTSSRPSSLTVLDLSRVVFLPGSESGLPALATNLSTVDINLSSLAVEDFPALIRNDYQGLNNFFPRAYPPLHVAYQLPQDKSQRIILPLSEDGAPLSPGLYVCQISAPPLKQQSYILVVSNVQLVFKLSATGVLVWATRLEDRAAVAGAPVVIYDGQGESLIRGQTDAQGIFQAEVSINERVAQPFYVILGQPGQDDFSLALAGWGPPVSLAPPAGTKTYLYTDQSSYYPGQTVHFRAVVRQYSRDHYRLPELTDLEVKLLTAEGEELAILKTPLSPYGTASGEYLLPEDISPGNYVLKTDYGERGFQVVAHKRPGVDLNIMFKEDQARSGQRVTFQIKAKDAFGFPAVGASLEWSLRQEKDEFFLPGYWIGTQGYWQPQVESTSEPYHISGMAETDSQGQITLTIPTEMSKDTHRLILEARTAEDDNAPLQGNKAQASLTLHPADFYIAIRPELWFLQPGEKAGFEILTVNWQRQPVANLKLLARFEKVTWLPLETNIDSSTQLLESLDSLLDSAEFICDSRGKARITFTPPEAGAYRLTVTSDEALPQTRTQVLIWVSGSAGNAWPQLPNHELHLVVSPPPYRPEFENANYGFIAGDVVELFIPNPYRSPTPALLTVERDRLLYYRLLTLEAGGSTISVPLSEVDTPNIFVTLTLLGRTSGHPDFRYGVVELQVKPLHKKLKVTLTSQPEKVVAGDEVTLRLSATDAGGKPVQAEFSLAMVGRMNPAETEDYGQGQLGWGFPLDKGIVDAFYQPQRLQVSTGLSLVAYSGFTTAYPEVSHDSFELPRVASDDYAEMVYWNPSLVTDSDGQTQVKVSLPQGAAVWRLEARGLTADTAVGQAEITIVASQSLYVQPVTPRFVVTGDHVEMAVVVENRTQTDLAGVVVTLHSVDFVLDNPVSAVQKVDVPANGQIRVNWWGKVSAAPSFDPVNVELCDLVFTVQMPGVSGQDGSVQSLQRALPVFGRQVSATFLVADVLGKEGKRLEVVSLPDKKLFQSSQREDIVLRGELALDLSPSLGTVLMTALDDLEHASFSSVEGVLSSFLPALVTYRVFQGLGMDMLGLQGYLERTLQPALSKLYDWQKQDGGWSWQPQDEETDPFLTAYVVFGLSLTEKQGISIDPRVLSAARGYLFQQVRDTQDKAVTTEAWQLERLAFEYFALSQSGELPQEILEGVNVLYQQRANLSPVAKALLISTLLRGQPVDFEEHGHVLLADLQASVVQSAVGAFWEDDDYSFQNMATPLWMTAVVVYVLAQQEPASPALSEAVRYLATHRRPGSGWSSTFETSWTVLALAEAMRGRGELGGNFDFSASLNHVRIAEGQKSAVDTPFHLMPVIIRLPLGENLNPPFYSFASNILEIQRGAGSGRLYYTAQLSFAPASEVTCPTGHGLSLERAYFPAKTSAINLAETAERPQPLQGAQVGQHVLVRLTLTLAHDAYYLVVEDPIPAGAAVLTADSTNLAQPLSLLMGNALPQQGASSTLGVNFEEVHFSKPLIFDDHITWMATYLPAGTYELIYRLILLQPGEYHVLAGRAYQMYYPQVQGNSAEDIFTIEEVVTK